MRFRENGGGAASEDIARAADAVFAVLAPPGEALDLKVERISPGVALELGPGSKDELLVTRIAERRRNVLRVLLRPGDVLVLVGRDEMRPVPDDEHGV